MELGKKAHLRSSTVVWNNRIIHYNLTELSPAPAGVEGVGEKLTVRPIPTWEKKSLEGGIVQIKMEEK